MTEESKLLDFRNRWIKFAKIWK